MSQLLNIRSLFGENMPFSDAAIIKFESFARNPSLHCERSCFQAQNTHNSCVEENRK